MPENDKPTMTEDEIAHNERMAADQGDEDGNDPDINRARNDPAPVYREEQGNDPPDYDPIEATDAPEYDDQPTFDEWMRSGDVEGLNDN